MFKTILTIPTFSALVCCCSQKTIFFRMFLLLLWTICHIKFVVVFYLIVGTLLYCHLHLRRGFFSNVDGMEKGTE